MPPAASLRAQARRFREFRRIYNDIRPHEALGQTPPAEHYTASARKFGIIAPDGTFRRPKRKTRRKKPVRG
jgi:hypothetical protein